MFSVALYGCACIAYSMYMHICMATYGTVEVHHSCSLRVYGRPVLITRYEVHAQHPVPLVYLRAHQLLQLLQFILEWREGERGGKGGREGGKGLV